MHFSAPEPFTHFQATKLQSFVMNNCTCPQRNFRGVRLFAVLARAIQLSRLELVSVRFFGEHLKTSLTSVKRDGSGRFIGLGHQGSPPGHVPGVTVHFTVL